MKSKPIEQESNETGEQRALRYIHAKMPEIGTEIKRDEHGKFLGCGNPYRARDVRITALRHKMREHFDGVETELFGSITQDLDPKLKAAAMKIWFDYSVPKIKGEDVSDMQKSARAALEKVGELPVADQPKKLLQMFYKGEISEYVLDITTRAISQAQHIHDEELERRLVELEKNNDEK